MTFDLIPEGDTRNSRVFDIDPITKDWPMPQPIVWTEEQSLWQKFKARCAEIFAAWGEPMNWEAR